MSLNPGQVITISAVLISLSSIAVALRLYVRRTRRTPLGLDDWTIVVALVLGWVLSILLFVGSAIGALGQKTPLDHKTDLDTYYKNHATSGRIEYASYVIITLAFGFIKISVVSLYRRIFVTPRFRYISLGLLIFIGLWTMAFFIPIVLWCGTNPAVAWSSYDDIITNCINIVDLELAFAVTDTVTDLVVILMPIPMLWTLRLSVKRKLALTAIFLLGFFSTTSSIMRMIFIIINFYESSVISRDFLGLLTNVEVWIEVEVCIALIAACLPTIRPLFSCNSPACMLESIRSFFSLNNLNGSRASILGGNRERHAQNIEENMVGCEPKDLQNGLSTEITRSNPRRAGVDGQHIIVTQGISFIEEHALPLTRGDRFGCWAIE